MAKIHHTRRWRKTRDKALKKASLQCQHCKRYGKLVPAKMAHHIIPVGSNIDIGINLEYSQENLLALCNSCHDQMHDRNNDTLTNVGFAWILRRFKQYPPHQFESLKPMR